jgi:Flp pilus assembly protein TadD
MVSRHRAFPSGFVMRSGIARTLVVAAAGLWLAGCSTSSDSVPDIFSMKTPGADAFAAAPPADGSDTAASAPLGMAASSDASLLGSDPNDDLNLGKKQYRANNFGLAEKYFRRAIELHPRDAEAWLDLAASYDRLRRFDLADRAYNQAIGIVGPTAEILNNQGYSYMLRGDYAHAREKLAAAQREDPRSKFVQNNIQLLEESSRKGKAIE